MKRTLAHGLAAALKDIREIRHLTQAGLAERAGLDRSYVNNIEQGTRSPGLTTLESLAGALGLKVSDLIKAAEEEAQQLSRGAGGA